MIGTRVIETRLMPDNSIAAITLFGLVFTRDRRYIDRQMMTHELIHCQQQLECLYLPFIVLYLMEWLINLIRYRNRAQAYHEISFEREAYGHENEVDYPQQRRHYANYRTYN